MKSKVIPSLIWWNSSCSIFSMSFSHKRWLLKMGLIKQWQHHKRLHEMMMVRRRKRQSNHIHWEFVKKIFHCWNAVCREPHTWNFIKLWFLISLDILKYPRRWVVRLTSSIGEDLIEYGCKEWIFFLIFIERKF